ncbi:MAG: phosphotransferase family protein [Chloroflexi bacterium]|nr:phosphotransferase family protein [Chloroflexota bacterium]
MADHSAEPLLDLPALERWVNQNVPGEKGGVTVEKHVAGFSNETFYVTRGAQRWVMRRPPRGPLLPTAHDVLREHRFIAGLYGLARVPRPVGVCEDASVIGAPFYLMERKDGIVMRDEIPAEWDTPAGHRKIAEEMIDALVELHAVDWRAAGIPGREGGYVARQVERWAGQWELAKKRTRDLPGMDEITAWLKAHMPPEVPHTVVHGDYKLDNVMFARGPEPHLNAIFDWEMATVGDPLADLGYLMNTWTNRAPPHGFEDRPLLRTGLTEREGFPSTQAMADMYEAKSGRSMHNFLFYRVLAAYKGISIIEGLYMHYIEGAAANPGAADFEWRVPMMIASCQELIASGGA